VAKIPMAAGFLLGPSQVVGAGGPVPDMAAAIGAVRGSAMGQAQSLVVGKSGVPAQGIPRRGKVRRVTDTGTNTLPRYRGLSGEVYREAQSAGRQWVAESTRGQAQALGYLTQTGHR
jgi:hypothetical protein